MSDLAIITPSHVGDYERCQLLNESFQHCAPNDAIHYIIADQRDAKVFDEFSTRPNTKVLITEQVLAGTLHALPFFPKWRLGPGFTLVRSWILQQLIKLSMLQSVKEEVLVFVDSDTCFIRPFDTGFFFRDDKVRLLAIPGRGNMPLHHPWHRGSARLLGLTPENYFGYGFIGNILSWRRDTALSLLRHLESHGNGSWFRQICGELRFSEYTLYGIYCTHVLGPEKSGHYLEQEVKHVCEYWKTTPLVEDQLKTFFARVAPTDIGIMISSKSHTPVDSYRDKVASYWATQSTTD